jgi:hypothetical protein
MPFVYSKVRDLGGKPLVGKGDCVELVKWFAPGLKGVPTSSWKAGASVVDVAKTLTPGTAIAPQRVTGQHAAFFVSSAGAGIWVMDQWKDDQLKRTISLRHIPRRGKTRDGKWKDPSNNAEAVSVIER